MCTLIYLFLAARFSGDHADEQQGLVTELKLAMVVYDKISSMIFISFSFFFLIGMEKVGLCTKIYSY